MANENMCHPRIGETIGLDIVTDLSGLRRAFAEIPATFDEDGARALLDRLRNELAKAEEAARRAGHEHAQAYRVRPFTLGGSGAPDGMNRAQRRAWAHKERA